MAKKLIVHFPGGREVFTDEKYSIHLDEVKHYAELIEKENPESVRRIINAPFELIRYPDPKPDSKKD